MDMLSLKWFLHGGGESMDIPPLKWFLHGFRLLLWKWSANEPTFMEVNLHGGNVSVDMPPWKWLHHESGALMDPFFYGGVVFFTRY